ncbi:hypothetical protein CLCR_07273 [Cladophialophora carrionii]|uniref:NTF2-like domain-containing protein n=1 Tax=Cladophialophora carrionii TaxID=86049 RepID=A0A1C1CNQ1_9EURO|nr:hypothetical protein CLCR_07273 [Cladophialophora carrionii]
MQYMSVVLPLAAMVSGALANPTWGDKACQNNACLAAVTGKAALGDGKIRASHCASYLATTVTPIVTETVTITGKGHDNWKRATVALCPNEVPNYASACDDAAYTSACSCFGYTEIKTTTVAPTTTTKTIWVKPTGGAESCSASTVTTTSVVVSGSTCPAASTTTSTKVVVTGTTVTKTGGATTVTETKTETKTVTKDSPSATSSVPASSCKVDDALATTLVNNFVDLLQFTSYAGDRGPPGRGYHQDVSDATLATDFIDISDSINFMAGFPLGSITFNSKQAFDIGQGVMQPEVTVKVLNIWHDCNTVTFRWRIVSLPFPVNGINHMEINKDGLVQKNYAEFDNGAWLQSFGQNCTTNQANPPVTVAPSVALKARDLF